MLYDSAGERVGYSRVLGICYDDIVPLENCTYTNGWPVEGGFLNTISIKKPGTFTMAIREYKDEYRFTYCEKNIGKITVADYEKEYRAWMREIVAKCVQSDMTKPEQMQAISSYLKRISKYHPNYRNASGNLMVIMKSVRRNGGTTIIMLRV